MTPSESSRGRASPLARVSLALGTCVVALLLAEAIVRSALPTDPVAAALISAEAYADLGGSLFELDESLGFRPVAGINKYTETGTVLNAYPAARRPGVERLLFIGDSVTRRGEIIGALRERLGETHFEYWNAGVESFNTVQEVRFLEDQNLAAEPSVEPNRVILTLHINDYQTTPAAFIDPDGALVVYAFGHAPRRFNRWLFAHCHLYRLATRPQRAALETLVDTVEHFRLVDESLARLKELSIERGFDLSVLVHPILDHRSRWSFEEGEAHRAALESLKSHEIEHIDLWPVFVRAIKAGHDRKELREQPKDSWHPSSLMAGLIADHVIATWSERTTKRAERAKSPTTDRPPSGGESDG